MKLFKRMNELVLKETHATVTRMTFMKKEKTVKVIFYHNQQDKIVNFIN